MRKFSSINLLAVAVLILAACQTPGGITFDSAEKAGGSNKATTARGLLFTPKAQGTHPAVVLLHTCGGVKQHVSQDWPEFLTTNGYVVLTVDSFTGCQRGRNLPLFLKQALDAYGALAYLAEQPFVDGNRIAVMGFSAGARAINGSILNGAAIPSDSPRDFKAAISVYGDCQDLWAKSDDAPQALQIVAELDVQYASGCIEAADSEPKIDIRVLKGAHHAFDQQNLRSSWDITGKYMVFSQSALDEAKEATLAFLSKHLK